MVVSKAKFEKAVEIISSLPKEGSIQPTLEDQLFFYKYFKQGTVGDVNIPRPGMLDFSGKAKWDAWKSVNSTTAEEAWEEYVKKLIEILERVNDDVSREALAALEAV